MKILTIFALIVAGSISLALISGCNKKADKNLQDAQENAAAAGQNVRDAAANTAKDEWLNFKSAAEARIEDNNKIIADYKVKMTNTKGKLSASYDKKIDALELKNKDLKAKLAAYKDEGKDAWDKFRTEFSKDMDDLGESLKGFTDDSTK